MAATRTWGGLTERLLVAAAGGYVVSPEALGAAASDPACTRDRPRPRTSWRWLPGWCARSAAWPATRRGGACACHCSGSTPPSATHAEVTAAAAPEQVWEAIATGPGHAEWLFGADIDGREGGAMVLHRAPFGPDAAARVTGWDPPRRFAYTEPLARDDGGAVPWPRRSWSRRAAVAPAWCGVVSGLPHGDEGWEELLEGAGRAGGWP